MLDLKFIKEHKDEVKQNITNRFMTADVDAVLDLNERRIGLQQKADDARQQRNENAARMKGPLTPDERTPLIEEGKRLKDEIAALESELEEIKASLSQAHMRIPNMAHPDAPVGKEEKDNLEIERYGDIPQFSFTPKDHVELGQSLDLIDFDTGAKVSGTKFYYLKNQAVILEFALTRYALDLLGKHGFTPMITPDIAREEVVEGIGFNPRGEESNIYTLEGTGTCLVGTAEITLGGYHAQEILDPQKLPIKYAGVSHCFRREAGASGQYSKGLYRVHQFSKIEMFVYCLPEDSDNIHQELKGIEVEMFTGLGIPFRVVDTCTGDLGAPAYRKYDLEAWMPGRGENGGWGEITSTSNCTDYQARRLGVRYKTREGKTEFVHMLNGTAIAISRAVIALMENYQQADGSIAIPGALVPYCGFSLIGPKTN
ncbi:MAG: serine--tRNA ligase [Spirochaetales bacterium]|nr:serine--tRNA ligase [Spirochaetales bacterium]